MSHTDTDFRTDCNRLVAKTAMAAAESMTTSERIMIHQGIANLFPTNSPEHQHAQEVADDLSRAEQNQLRLFRSLDA